MLLGFFSRSSQKEHERQQCQYLFKLRGGAGSRRSGFKIKDRRKYYGIKFLRPGMCHTCLRMES